MDKRRIALGPSLLVFAALACDLPSVGAPVQPSDSGAVQTSVAATVVALVPPPTPGPLADEPESEVFQDFAIQVDEAVRRDDAAFFASRLGDQVRCTGLEEPPLEGTEQTPHPCLGQPAGLILRVLHSADAESGYGGLYAEDEYARVLGEWFRSAVPSEADAFGGGAPALHAIVTWFPEFPVVDVSRAAVLTGIVRLEGMDSAVRQARVLGFQYVDGRWWITGELVAWLFEWSPEAAELWLSGDCEACYDEWEAWTSPSP